MNLADIATVMANNGCSPEQIAGTLRDLQAAEEATSNAARQARYRARKKLQTVTENVTQAPAAITKTVTLPLPTVTKTVTNRNGAVTKTVTNRNEIVTQAAPEPSRTRAFFMGEEEVIDPPEGLPSVAPPSEKSAPSKPVRALARTAIAPDAQPTDRDRAAAVAAGLVNGTFRQEWQKFRDKHLSKGSLMADWSAAWRTWISNVPQFSGSQRSGPADRSHSVGAALERLQNRLELDEQTLQFDIGPSPLLAYGSGKSR